MAKRKVNLVVMKNDFGEIIIAGIHGQWEKSLDHKNELLREGWSAVTLTDLEMNTPMLLRLSSVNFPVNKIK